jgi:hypothetical protein
VTTMTGAITLIRTAGTAEREVCHGVTSKRMELT